MNTRHITLTFTCALLLLALPGLASAEEIKLNCSYSNQGVQTEWNEKGQPKISNGGFGSDSFMLTLNTDTGDARLMANSTVEVVMVPSSGSLNFLEQTPTGLSITSVYFQIRLPDGQLPFVQSRHLDLAGPFPQQYYGSCQPLG